MMPAIPLYYTNTLELYDFGYGHPFRGKRFREFIEVFKNLPGEAKGGIHIVEPRLATKEDAGLVHTKGYIRMVEAMDLGNGGMLSPDTYITPGILKGTYSILGSALSAADYIVTQRKNELTGHRCGAITLGGLHHANANSGEGFCVFNDVAICAEYLLNKKGLGRIAIIDTDAHAGNGTMDIFYGRNDVLFISIHQDPKTLYPGRCFANEIGTGDGKGYTVNIPLPPYSNWSVYKTVIEEIVKPIVLEFKPEVIIRNGGSDPYYGDTLTTLGLCIKDFFYLGRYIADIADDTGAGLISMSVSGYGPHTVYGWIALIEGQFTHHYYVDFDDRDCEYWHHSHRQSQSQIDALIVRLKDILGEYWNL